MITLTLKPDYGDPIEITADSRDVYVWEKTNRGKALGQLMDNPSVVDLYEIAWHAARRQNLFTGKIDEFVATYELEYEDSGEGEEEKQQGPFLPAPSAVPPSGSPSTPASRRASGSTKARK